MVQTRKEMLEQLAGKLEDGWYFGAIDRSQTAAAIRELIAKCTAMRDSRRVLAELSGDLVTLERVLNQIAESDERLPQKGDDLILKRAAECIRVLRESYQTIEGAS